MKRFITLILMFVTLITFVQKATAFSHLLENETTSMVNCSMVSSAMVHDSMSMNSSDSHMKMNTNQTDCAHENTSMPMDCQNDCDVMNMVSVLYFNEYIYTVHQIQSQFAYQTNIIASPYYFPESLYRPPFLN
jgi:hypothetical protein